MMSWSSTCYYIFISLARQISSWDPIPCIWHHSGLLVILGTAQMTRCLWAFDGVGFLSLRPFKEVTAAFRITKSALV